MKEYRVLDHNDDDRYWRFEIQERNCWCGLCFLWAHLTGMKTEDEALEHVNKLVDLYGKKGPTELYRTRVK